MNQQGEGHVKTGRLRCCVPYCKRTTSRTEFDEWICGEHWRLIGKKQRRVYGRRVRRWRRYHTTKDGVIANRLWTRLKQIAIRRAMGI